MRPACSQCHPSFGYTDHTFDFAGDRHVDCFVCHDTTGTYAKSPTGGGGGGQAALAHNGQLVLAAPADMTPVIYNLGMPTKRNCGACHFYADGGDNVMHGDMSSDLLNATEGMDVHIGGQGFECQTCHTMQSHGIAGFTLHSVNEGGASPNCTRCHSATAPHTRIPRWTRCSTCMWIVWPASSAISAPSHGPNRRSYARTGARPGRTSARSRPTGWACRPMTRREALWSGT